MEHQGIQGQNEIVFVSGQIFRNQKDVYQRKQRYYDQEVHRVV